jgi:hypothetical protein
MVDVTHRTRGTVKHGTGNWGSITEPMIHRGQAGRERIPVLVRCVKAVAVQ